jgi:hypothetical protein
MDGAGTPQGDLRRAKIHALGATVEEYGELLPYLTYAERAELDALLEGVHLELWEPFPGPQSAALDCPADELFYGGAAGGGKSDLLLGCAILRHWRSAIFRREYAELKGIRERAEELFDDIGKFNGQTEIWRMLRGKYAGKRIEFGACQYEGDERKFQGRAHDFKGFDEITQFTESQYRFLITWNRSVHRGQRVRTVVTGNPPVSAEGRWVISYWAPWLDPGHPRPAQQGELRWFVTGPDGKDLEVDGIGPHTIRMGDGSEEIVTARSRTFIRARVEDNPRLLETGYRTVLQNLPEPLRSRMLRGDFGAGIEDAEWQVIPTDWVLRAQARWAPTYEEFLTKRARLKFEQGLAKERSDSGSGQPAEAPTPPTPHPRPPCPPAADSFTPIYAEPDVPESLKGGTGVDLSALFTASSRDGSASSASGLQQFRPPSPEELAEARASAEKDGAIGVDVSRGGKDDTIISERLGTWFASLKAIPGRQTKDGNEVIQVLIGLGWESRRIQIDVTGVGTSPVDVGKMYNMNIIPMINSGKSNAKDKSGKLAFVNLRAEWWWKFREALDPTLGDDIALPPDAQLLADLTAPRWQLSARGIQVEAKEHIKARLASRSPDRGDAVVLAHAVPREAAEAYLAYLREQVELSTEEARQKDAERARQSLHHSANR